MISHSRKLASALLLAAASASLSRPSYPLRPSLDLSGQWEFTPLQLKQPDTIVVDDFATEIRGRWHPQGEGIRASATWRQEEKTMAVTFGPLPPDPHWAQVFHWLNLTTYPGFETLIIDMRAADATSVGRSVVVYVEARGPNGEEVKLTTSVKLYSRDWQTVTLAFSEWRVTEGPATALPLAVVTKLSLMPPSPLSALSFEVRQIRLRRFHNGTSGQPLLGDFSDDAHPAPPVVLEQAAPKTTLLVPSDWRAAPVTLSLTPHHFGLYECHVAVPKDWAKRRLTLRFEGVGFACAVSVNGKRVGAHWGSFTPFELDVSKHARAGATITIGVLCASDRLALHSRPPSEVYPNGPEPGVPVLWHPRGKTTDLRGLWQPCHLESRPAAFLGPLAVETSVARKSLCVSGRVDHAVPGLRVRITVFDGRSQVLTVTGLVRLRGRTGFRLQRAWQGPRLWSPSSPYLYRMRVELRANGRVTDAVEQPLGFREFSARNGRLFLNGHRVALYGSSITDDGTVSRETALRRFRWFRSMNFNTVQLHGNPHPEFLLEAADEVGLMVISESDLFGTGDAANYPYSDEAFRRAVKQDFAEWIERDRCHPCVVVWSMENETVAAWGYQEKGPLIRFLAWLREVTHQYDQTRPLEYESDGDPNGAADIICLHYPGEGYCATGAHGQLVKGGGAKPLMVGEFGCIDDSKGSAARWVGDAAFHEPWRQSEAIGLYYKATIEGWRRGQVDGIVPFQWHYAEPQWAPPGKKSAWLEGEFRRLFAPVLLTVTDPKEEALQFEDAGTENVTNGCNLLSGERLRKLVHLCNESDYRLEGALRWSLRFGATTGSGQRQLALSPWSVQTADVVVECPAVADEAEGCLEIEFVPRGHPNLVARETMDLRLFPASFTVPPTWPGTVLLYDPVGETAAVLRRAGLRFSTLADFEGLIGRTLIIGRNSLDEKVITARSRLCDFARAGNTVLFFEQWRRQDQALPRKLRVAVNQRAFVSVHSQDHPVFDGIEGPTLGGWRGYPQLLRSGYVKPVTGRFRCLAGASSDPSQDRWLGSEQAALVEFLEGRGRILVSQLELTGHYGRDPVATRITHNLLHYVARAEPLPTEKGVALITGKSEQTEQALTEAFGRDWQRISVKELSRRGPDLALVTEGDSLAPLAAERIEIESFVRSGGTVLCLHIPRSEWSPAWLPSSVEIGSTGTSRYVLPALPHERPPKAGEASPFSGISAADLSANDIWDQEARVRDPLTRWSPEWEVLAWAGSEWTGDRHADFFVCPQRNRAAALTLQLGRGRYVLVQALLDCVAGGYPGGNRGARRAFHTLLANLGAAPRNGSEAEQRG